MANCTAEDATEIVVSIATNLSVPAEMNEVDFRVERQGQLKVEKHYSLDPKQPGYFELPGTVSLVANDQPEIPVLITITGKKAGKSVVVRKAKLTFLKGKSLLLKMDLLRSCAQRKTPCINDQTCTAKGCESIVVDPKTLPEYDKKKAFTSPEAGVVADAGPPDKRIPDKRIPDKRVPDKTISDKTVPDKTVPDKTIPDKTVPDKTIPDMPVPDMLVPDQLVPDQLVPDMSIPDQLSPDTTAPITHTKCSSPMLVQIVDGKATITDDTSKSTDEYSGVGCKNANGPWPGPQLYYRVALQAGKTYAMQLVAPTWDPSLYAFPFATPCNANAINLACGANSKHSSDLLNNGTIETITITPTKTEDWVVVVDSWSATSKGPFTLTFTQHGVLDPNGIEISPVLSVPSNSKIPSVGFDGTNHLVGWSQNFSAVQIVRVSTAGAVLDKPAKTVSSSTLVYHNSPSISYGNSNYLLTWSAGAALPFATLTHHATRVSASGAAMDTPNLKLTTFPSKQNTIVAVQSAYNGGKYLAVTQEYTSGWKAIAQLIGPMGSIYKSGIGLTSSASEQHYLAVASDNTNFFVVWSDTRHGTTQIYGTRIDSTGKVLDPSGIHIGKVQQSTGPDAGVADAGPPDAGPADAYYNPDFSGTSFSSQTEPSVAFDGSSYLVVWADKRKGTWDIYGTRVSTGGSVMDPGGFPISTASGIQGLPTVSYNSNGYLVAWADDRAGDSDIRGIGVTNGKLSSIGEIIISNASKDQHSPKASSNKGHHLVVWLDKRGSYDRIYGARVVP